MHVSQICGLKWSPDDRELASGGNDNQLFIWGLNNTSPVIRFSDHQAAVKALAWSPHQHGLIASGGGTADRCIRFWNTATASPLNCIDTGLELVSLYFTTLAMDGCADLHQGRQSCAKDAGLLLQHRIKFNHCFS